MKNLLVLIIALFAFFGCGEDESSSANFKEFSPNEEVKLVDVSGKELTLVRKDHCFAIKNDESKVLSTFLAHFAHLAKKRQPSLQNISLKTKINLR